MQKSSGLVCSRLRAIICLFLSVSLSLRPSVCLYLARPPRCPKSLQTLTTRNVSEVTDYIQSLPDFRPGTVGTFLTDSHSIENIWIKFWSTSIYLIYLMYLKRLDVKTLKTTNYLIIEELKLWISIYLLRYLSTSTATEKVKKRLSLFIFYFSGVEVGRTHQPSCPDVWSDLGRLRPGRHVVGAFALHTLTTQLTGRWSYCNTSLWSFCTGSRCRPVRLHDATSCDDVSRVSDKPHRHVAQNTIL